MSSEAIAHEEGPTSLAAAPSRDLHPRAFKLRFATQHELGRSHVSAVKPFALPATVTGKFHRRTEGELDVALEASALARITNMFQLGPKQKYPAPLTTSHEYGWWCEQGGRWQESSRLHHHISDSAWLKERLRVLAADASFKRC